MSPTEVKIKAVKILWFMIMFWWNIWKITIDIHSLNSFSCIPRGKHLLSWNCLNLSFREQINFVVLGKISLSWPRCFLCFSSIRYTYVIPIYNRKSLRGHKIYLEKTDAIYKILVVDILKKYESLPLHPSLL